jgi:hypothetical protein
MKWVDVRPINLAYVPKQIIVGTFAFLTYQEHYFFGRWPIVMRTLRTMRFFTIRRVLGKSYSCLRYLSDLFGQQGFYVIFIMLHQLSFFECRHFFWTPMFSFVFFEHGQQEFLCSKFNVVCSPHVKTIPISVYQLHQPPRSNGIQGPKRWRESGGLFFYIYIYNNIYILLIITINI